MLAERNDFDKIIHHKLWDYSTPPPEGLWDSIEARLDLKIRKRRSIKIISMAASLLLLIFSGWWLNHSLKYKMELSVNRNSPKTSVITSAKSISGQKKDYSPDEPKNAANSLASFAADLSFSEKKNQIISTGEEPVSYDIEKKIDDHFQSGKIVLNKISALFESLESTKVQHISNNPSNIEQKQLEIANLKWDQAIGIESGKNREKICRWMIGTEVSPIFTCNIENLPGQVTQAKDVLEIGIIGKYNLNRKVSFKSGILFNQLKEKTDYLTANQDYSHSPAGVIIWKSNIITHNESHPQVKQEFSFIEIPLLAEYKFINKKINLGVTGGISTNILLTNKAVYQDNTGSSQNGKTGGIRDIAYGGVAGFEIGYNIGKMAIYIEPQLKYYLHSLNADSDLPFKPVQLAIRTGITYSFE